jgi:uncharacterized Zn finger protein
MALELMCPHCESSNDEPDECYEEGEIYSCQCNSCGKVFGFTFKMEV